MRSILQLLLIGILVACNGNGTEGTIEIPANEIGTAKENDTFQALGIRYDSSHNGAEHPEPSALPFDPALADPVEHEGVIEVPVSQIRTPGGGGYGYGCG